MTLGIIPETSSSIQTSKGRGGSMGYGIRQLLSDEIIRSKRIHYLKCKGLLSLERSPAERKLEMSSMKYFPSSSHPVGAVAAYKKGR